MNTALLSEINSRLEQVFQRNQELAGLIIGSITGIDVLIIVYLWMHFMHP